MIRQSIFYWEIDYYYFIFFVKGQISFECSTVGGEVCQKSGAVILIINDKLLVRN